MRQLIVNADDFGLTEQVNQGIVEGYGHGIITSTTLMANGRAFDSAVELARNLPQLGVGIHLNLTEGRPVALSSKASCLVDADGNFRCSPGQLASQAWFSRHWLAAMEVELRAQTEKILATGLVPTHYDGHKHFHAAPLIFNIIVRLAREYGVGGIRCVCERRAGLASLLRNNPESGLKLIKQYLAGQLISLLSYRARSKAKQAGLARTDRLLGITATGFLDLPVLKRLLDRLPPGCSELMCHPGYVDDALRRTPTRLLAQRTIELQALTSPAIRQRIEISQIQLINYRSLSSIHAR